jgi:hypothetical protein
LSFCSFNTAPLRFPCLLALNWLLGGGGQVGFCFGFVLYPGILLFHCLGASIRGSFCSKDCFLHSKFAFLTGSGKSVLLLPHTLPTTCTSPSTFPLSMYCCFRHWLGSFRYIVQSHYRVVSLYCTLFFFFFFLFAGNVFPDLFYRQRERVESWMTGNGGSMM